MTDTPDNTPDKPKKTSGDGIPMVEKRRLNTARLERLPEVMKLYLQGVPTRAIAKRVGVKVTDIYMDLRYARTKWLKKIEKSAEEYLTLEVEKINLIETQAWEQWERSKLDAETKGIERDNKGKIVKKTSAIKGQCGDPRYLEVALKCVDKRCRMLKIGEYSKEESLTLQAKVVEVVVENVDQVNRIIDYDEYDRILKPSEN